MYEYICFHDGNSTLVMWVVINAIVGSVHAEHNSVWIYLPRSVLCLLVHTIKMNPSASSVTLKCPT